MHNNNRIDWASITGVIGYLLIALWIMWGIGWSFYRHGPVHGAASVVIPPYAMYRGVAAIWEEPEWKEDWNVNTEYLAMLIMASGNPDNDFATQSSMTSASHGLKNWITRLPDEEKTQLYHAILSLRDAWALTDEIFFSSMKNHFQIDSIEYGLLLKKVSEFESIEGYRTAWDRYKTQSDEAFQFIREQYESLDQKEGEAWIDAFKASSEFKYARETSWKLIDLQIEELFDPPAVGNLE